MCGRPKILQETAYEETKRKILQSSFILRVNITDKNNVLQTSIHFMDTENLNEMLNQISMVDKSVYLAVVFCALCKIADPSHDRQYHFQF